jgi:hypothetical protein
MDPPPVQTWLLVPRLNCSHCWHLSAGCDLPPNSVSTSVPVVLHLPLVDLQNLSNSTWQRLRTILIKQNIICEIKNNLNLTMKLKCLHHSVQLFNYDTTIYKYRQFFFLGWILPSGICSLKQKAAVHITEMEEKNNFILRKYSANRKLTVPLLE